MDRSLPNYIHLNADPGTELDDFYMDLNNQHRAKDGTEDLYATAADLTGNNTKDLYGPGMEFGFADEDFGFGDE